MEDISTQFQVKFSLAPWIKKAMKIVPNLINKEVPNVYPINIPEPLFWMISPKDSKKIYLYGQLDCSFQRQIFSINITKDSPDLIAYCGPCFWYRLKRARAASSLAKIMDGMIHGWYTDLPLLHADGIFDIVDEKREDI